MTHLPKPLQAFLIALISAVTSKSSQGTMVGWNHQNNGVKTSEMSHFTEISMPRPRLLQEKGAALQPRWVMGQHQIPSDPIRSLQPPGQSADPTDQLILFILTQWLNFSMPFSFCFSWFVTFDVTSRIKFSCFLPSLSFIKHQKLQEIRISYLNVAHDSSKPHFGTGTGEDRSCVVLLRCGARSGEAVADAGTQPCPVPQGWRHCRCWVFLFPGWGWAPTDAGRNR